MLDLSGFRNNYTKHSLIGQYDEKNPVRLFEQWLQESIAANEIEPNAMTLSTVNESGRPSSRVVLLKGIDAEGHFLFFTNYESRKGSDLLHSPYCALNFLWLKTERQVRIEGVVSKISPEESDRYFASRPQESQISASISPQSKVIPDRVFLIKRAENFRADLNDKPIKRPENWGGYSVKPTLIEFWQGGSFRLHDRICYSSDNDGNWNISRLAP